MDQELEVIIRGMIRTERSGREIPISDALAQVTSEFTQRGASGHGRYPVMLDREVAREYEWRADKWFSIVRKVVSDAGLTWTPDRARDLRHLLETELLTDWDELVERLRQRPSRGAPARMDELDNAKDRALGRISQQLELLVFAQDRSRIPISERLSAPRYAPVLLAWKKARDFLDRPTPDYNNAAKEAVGAVEQLARIVTNEQNATLGEAIKKLRSSSRIHTALLKGIEELWAWASDTPGVRHGSAAPVQVDANLARYVVAQADAAIGFLLGIDAA